MPEDSEAPAEHSGPSHSPSGTSRPLDKAQTPRSPATKSTRSIRRPPETAVPSTVGSTESATELRTEPPHDTWQGLVDAMISAEVFCKEIDKVATKWPAQKRIDAKHREKAAKVLSRLAAWGRAALSKVSAVLKREPNSKPVTPAPPEIEVACRRLQAAGIKKMLRSLIDKITSLVYRLHEQYTSENRQKIDEDFHSLSREVASFTPVAQGVRESLQKRLDLGSADWGGAKVLAPLITAISKVLNESTTSIGQAWVKNEYEEALRSRINWAESTRRSFEILSAESKKQVGKHLDALLRRDAADAGKFQCFLETLGIVCGTALMAVRFAEAVLANASLGVDAGIETLASKLREAIDKLRVAITELDDMVWRYRDVIARVPFKRQEANKRPMPWGQLDARQRDIVAVLVRRRAVDPLGVFYAVSKHALEKELGVSANNSTLDRDLNDLDGLEIVGKYQPIASAEDQRPGHGYWIEEYAYEKYRPEVLGKA